MKNRATERFWKALKKLPAEIKETAEEQFEVFKINPFHPSLHFKKLGTFWSIRITLEYRALAIKDEEGYIWVWIGTHDEYDKISKRF